MSFKFDECDGYLVLLAVFQRYVPSQQHMPMRLRQALALQGNATGREVPV